jgi:hypothetical protein
LALISVEAMVAREMVSRQSQFMWKKPWLLRGYHGYLPKLECYT